MSSNSLYTSLAQLPVPFRLSTSRKPISSMTPSSSSPIRPPDRKRYCLPQELWLKILDLLTPRTLCILCLVSRPFLQVARLSLYRNVVLNEIDKFDRANDSEDGLDEEDLVERRPVPQTVTFSPVFELLGRDESVARCVKTLFITMALACPKNDRLPMPLVLNAFKNLTALKQLTFFGGILLLKHQRQSLDVDKVLSRIRLDSLTVTRYEGVERCHRRSDPASSADDAGNFKLHYGNMPGSLEFLQDVLPVDSFPLWTILAQASSSSLTRLNINFSSFDDTGVLDLLANAHLNRLTALRLAPRDCQKYQPLLFRFLTSHSHCIEELDLDYPHSKLPLSGEDRAQCLSMLQPTSLPKLHTLKCPIEYMELLALARLSCLEHTLQRAFIYIRGKDQDIHLDSMFSAMRSSSLRCWNKVWELELNVSSWYEKTKVVETLTTVSQFCGSSLEIWHISVPPLIDATWSADQQTEEMEDMIDDPWTAKELGDLFCRFGELRILCMAGFPLPTFDGTAVEFLRETATRCPKFEGCYVGEVEGRLQKYDIERKADNTFEVILDRVWNGELHE